MHESFLQYEVNLNEFTLPDLIWITLEVHAKGDSTANFERNEVQTTWINANGYQAYYKLEILERLPTRSHRCNQKGNSMPHACVNELYMKVMNCSFPWIGNNTLPKCQSREDMATLTKLQLEWSNGNATLEEEWEKLTCTVPNCAKKHWQSFNEIRQFYRNETDRKFHIELYFMTWDVTKISEYLLYGFTNFLSDFGGYLGLLLGYSLLSVMASLLQKLQCCNDDS